MIPARRALAEIKARWFAAALTVLACWLAITVLDSTPYAWGRVLAVWRYAADLSVLWAIGWPWLLVTALYLFLAVQIIWLLALFLFGEQDE